MKQFLGIVLVFITGCAAHQALSPPPTLVKMECQRIDHDEYPELMALACTKKSFDEFDKSLSDMIKWQNDAYQKFGTKTKK